MSHADELWQLALEEGFIPAAPSQASLRRAVSTAYYALFHLLISDATANWQREELRPELGRLFEHGRMKAASEAMRNRLKTPSADTERIVFPHLLNVVDAFVQIQQRRIEADYFLAREWTQTEVMADLRRVGDAFFKLGDCS